MKASRRRCRRLLKGRYWSSPPIEIPTDGTERVSPGNVSMAGYFKIVDSPGSGQRSARARPIFLRATHAATAVFPASPADTLPPTWKVRFYERITWPPPAVGSDPPRHPFRLFLEITRCDAPAFTLPVHDARYPWLGSTEKVTTRLLTSPTFPRHTLVTYLVYRDDLSDVQLQRWICVLLAQRGYLIEAEEEALLEAIFLGTVRKWRTARYEAYCATKRRFLQPVGGVPTFPAYLGTTAARRMRDERARGAGEMLSDDEYVQLKDLRRQEPKLHRAVLYRIKLGKIQKVCPPGYEGEPCVKVDEVNAIEEARLANAADRQPKRFRDKRPDWIGRLLLKPGITPASAARKLKRWMNAEHLTRDEIEASVTKGRLVRLKPLRRGE